MNWIQRIAQSDLSWILSGPSEDSRVGQESGSPVSDGITVYSDPNGSHRYVYYENSQPIAAIQVVSNEEKSTVANIYTEPKYQRRGLATQLFQRAQSDFPNLQHSFHKTDEGGSWIDSLDESKPMALPKSPPSDVEWETSPRHGVLRIDEVMSPQTAEEQYNPNMDYYAHGSFGVLYQSDPGEVFKYTKDPREAETVKLVFEQQYDWIVPMLAPPEQVQDDPPIYKIRMKEMEELNRAEYELVKLLSGDLQRYRDGFLENVIGIDEVMEDFVPYLDVDKVFYIYERMKYIFQQNGDILWLTDLHGGNFGWDGEELKVWDVGPDRSK